MPRRIGTTAIAEERLELKLADAKPTFADGEAVDRHHIECHAGIEPLPLSTLELATILVTV